MHMKVYTFSKILTCILIKYSQMQRYIKLYDVFLKHPMYAVHLFPVCLHQNISFIRGGLFVSAVYYIYCLTGVY